MTDNLKPSLSEFAIRPAVPQDAPALFALICELADFEKLLSSMTATEDDIRQALFGPSPCVEALLVEKNNEPVAFALYFETFSTFAGRRGIYLEDLYVRPEFRGKKLGTLLLAHLGKIAFDRGCARFEWTVLDWNTPAIEFYKKMGAEPMSEWTVQRVSGESLAKLASDYESGEIFSR